MQDFLFDPNTREIVMKNGDFVLTDNPSVQNAYNLLQSQGANPLVPMSGIGLSPQIINGTPSELVYELNRWVAQAKNEGATLAKWKIVPNSRPIKLTILASYI